MGELEQRSPFSYYQIKVLVLFVDSEKPFKIGRRQGQGVSLRDAPT